MKSRILPGLLLAVVLGGQAAAAEFRSVGPVPAIMYDAPSLQAKRLYVASRNYPLEVVISLENWVKVRDASGELVWVEKRSLSNRRMVLVTAAVADIRQIPDNKAALVFQAERNVALDLIEFAATGWIRVRHSDGQTGFVQASQVWGI